MVNKLLPCVWYPDSFDNYKFIQIFDVDIMQNQVLPQRDGRSIEDELEDYMKSHDFTIPLSGLGSSVTLEGRRLDNDELSLKLKYDTEEKGEVEGNTLHYHFYIK